MPMLNHRVYEAALATLVVVIVIVAGIVTWRGVIHYAAAEIAWAVNGGDHYVWFCPDPSDMRSGQESIRLWTKADGPVFDVAWWISPAKAVRDAGNSEYWALKDKGGRAPVVRPGGVLSGEFLPRGNYTVEFVSRNGSWVQHLDFTGMLNQSVDRGKQKLNPICP